MKSIIIHALKRTLPAAAIAGLALLSGPAAAQQFPSRTISILYPLAFGSASDVVVRGIAENIQKNTGKVVVVESRPGGGGATAMTLLTKAQPDGHTVAFTHGGSILANAHTTPDLGWNYSNFTPITRLISQPNIFVGSPTFPAKNFAELIKIAKEKPDTVRMGMAGAGNKVWVAQLEAKTGAKFLWVPVSQSPFTLTMGGHIDVGVEAPPTVEALIKEGKLRNLGIGSPGTYAYMPDAELFNKTVPGFDMGYWWGMLAPEKLPQDRLQWLHREILAAVNETRLKAQIFSMGFDLTTEKPEQFADYLKKTDAVWGKIIRDYKIQ